MKKGIYCGEIDGHLIALHKKKKILNMFLTLYKYHNFDTLARGEINIRVITLNDFYSNIEYQHLYLVDWNNVWIQDKYLDVAQIYFESTVELNDLIISLRLLATRKGIKTKQEKKVLKEVIKELENKRDKKRGRLPYIPSIKLLEEAMIQLETCKHQMRKYH